MTEQPMTIDYVRSPSPSRRGAPSSSRRARSSGSGESNWSKSNTPRRDLPSNWKEIRRQVIALDGSRCTWQDADTRERCPATTDLEVDHKGRRDDHSLDNLRTRCRTHHARVTAAQGVRARKPRRREPEPHPGLLW